MKGDIKRLPDMRYTHQVGGMEMKIAIIGFGYVGQAIDRFFKEKYETVVYDPAKTQLCDNRDDIQTCDLAVVCVPTPMKSDGSCNTSIVEEVVGWLETPLIMVKSTVPPGTCSRIAGETGKRIVFSPEYIGESSYYTPPEWMNPTECIEHPYHIFGGEQHDTSAIIDIYLPIVGPAVRFIQMERNAAEMVKYMENAFGALKVTWCNEMYGLCEKLDLDWHTVREGWLADNRVSRCHTAVFADSRGYGGKCFPKDVAALVQFADGYAKLMEAVQSRNDMLRADQLPTEKNTCSK